MQPLFRSGCVWIINDGQAVVAVALVGGEAAVHEIRSVGNMDAICFNGQRRRIRLQLDTISLLTLIKRSGYLNFSRYFSARSGGRDWNFSASKGAYNHMH